MIISNLIAQIRGIYDGKLWMGDNMKQKLSSLSDGEAFAKPKDSLHSVAELVAHMTAWNQDARIQLETGKGVLQVNTSDDWPDNDSLQKKGWSEVVSDFEQSNDALTSFLATKEDSFLSEPSKDTDHNAVFTRLHVIEGIIHHQLYHLGQVGLVIKLIKEGK